jgi:hypothetical protein
VRVETTGFPQSAAGDVEPVDAARGAVADDADLGPVAIVAGTDRHRVLAGCWQRERTAGRAGPDSVPPPMPRCAAGVAGATARRVWRRRACARTAPRCLSGNPRSGRQPAHPAGLAGGVLSGG